MVSATRPPAVADLFYPGNPAQLSRTVTELLARCRPDPSLPTDVLPKALIAPHAGYVYSGSTAAAAYAQWAPWRAHIRRVVILGPTHRVGVAGIALPSSDTFATPLGPIAVDRRAIAELAKLPGVLAGRDDVHAQEHSLEVHLPFLQQVLGDSFSLVPLAVGQCTPAQVAAALDGLWDEPGTVCLVSSDLSHYQAYETAQAVDRDTCRIILDRQYLTESTQACGAFAINGLTLMATRRGLRPHLLAHCNSGDTAGDRQRVVGYASFAYAPSSAGELGEMLLTLARDALNQHFRIAAPPADVASPTLRRPGATFVTLTRDGRLRGCIGSLQAHRPLLQDVRDNALAAALRDPRFPPLTAAELGGLRVEVSLLSPAEALPVRDEADLLDRLQPGRDGLIFRAGQHQATFLPQVWEQLPEPAVFLAHLRQKAGLPADFWSPAVEVSRYTVDKWKEPPLPF